jgi:hydrogenase expression/formation protein HypE
VATVLNEMARDTRLGVEIWQKNLPLAEDVQGACELLGLDPLYVANEGIFIAVVAAEAAESVLEQLREDENGLQAAMIGEIVATHPKQVVLHSSIGGKRVVNMPLGEQLPRIC